MSALIGACAQGAPNADPGPSPAATTQSGTTPDPTAAPTSSGTAAAPAPTSSASGTDNAARPPVLTSISPSSATVGSVGPTVIVTGSNFVARTVVQQDGAPLATTFVSDTELRATIPTPSLAALGTLHISAGTSPPGGGASSALTFEVVNAAPTITTLSPLSVVAGAADTVVTISGQGFAATATVTVHGTAVKSTQVDPQTITATVPGAQLATSGTLDVVVTNPAPGGGASPPISFTVSNPAVQLTGVSPASALVNAAATPITITGSGFVAASSVLFNGSALATTYVSPTSLTATLPAASLTAVRDLPIAVKSPPPGGGVSMPVSFRVQYAAPVITTIVPVTLTAGAGASAVNVSGTGFYAASQVLFNGAATATTYLGPTSLTATLTAAQVASAGVISVSVSTPAPGGGASNLASISVQNPAPVLNTLAPASLTMGSPDTVLTVTGTSFMPNSIIQVNSGNVATTYVSATQLKATLTAAQLATPGALSITVTTPAPGGGTSAAKSLPIGCNSAGVDVLLSVVGNVTTLSTSFAAAPLYTRIDTSVSGGVCNTSFLSTSQPGRYYVVQNGTGVPVTLSSWAKCPDAGVQDDAYMTYYNGGTLPANDAQRAQCWTIVSEGNLGDSGNYPSPESGVSNYCPGLTKANGGGIGMNACDKVVVFIQAYNVASVSYPAPPQISFKAE